MDTLKRPHIAKIYDFLASSVILEKKDFIYNSLKELKPKGKIPSFFCRTPIFHDSFFDHGSRNYRDILISGYSNISKIEETMLIDHILANMTVVNLRMEFSGSFSDMDEILKKGHSVIDTNDAFKNLSQSNFTIDTPDGSVTFPIFTASRWSLEEGGKCLFVLSDEVASMYLLDTLVEYKKIKKITEMCLSLQEESSIRDSAVMDFLSIFRFITYFLTSSRSIQTTFFIDKMSPAILTLSSKSQLFSQLRNKKNNPIKRLLKFLKVEYNEEEDFFFGTENYVPAMKNAMYTENIIFSRPIDNYIDFKELEITPSLINKAESLNIPVDKIEIEFEIFKQAYQGYKKKYTKNGILSTWTNYIKSQFKSGNFDKYKKNAENAGSPETIVYNEDMRKQTELYNIDPAQVEPIFKKFKAWYIAHGKSRNNWVLAWMKWLEKEENRPSHKQGPNTGSAENITYTDEIIAKAKEQGYPESGIKNEFLRFKNHNIGEGRTKAKWIPAWEVWVSNSMERINKNGSMNAPGNKSDIEIAFIVKKKVSDIITDILKKKGFTVSDIVRQRNVTIKGISWGRVSPPPSFGKTDITLFRYTDQDLQRKAEKSVMAGMNIPQDKEEEETVIDAELV